MSAESPSRRSRCVPTVIPPQAVSDRSIIDSVTGFINEVGLNGAPPGDAKEQIIWSRFETDADISDLSFGEDWDLEEGVAPPPLILTLGYGTGIQMWAIPANGEAIEVLSWRHGGPVKCLKILPTPLMEYGDQAGPSVDIYHAKRPLIAISDSAAANVVNFVSLRDGDTVKSIKFKHPLVEILANRTTVVITFQERIAVFDARTFEDRCTVTTCFPSPGLNPNPVALGARWLAYAELKVMPSKRSHGGCDSLVNTSTMASVISAAKTLGKGLKGIGETIGLSTGGGGAGAHAATHVHGGVSASNAQYGGGGMGGGGVGHAGLARTGSAGGLSPSGSQQGLNASDGRQPGLITVMDIKYAIKDFSPTSGTPVSVKGTDPMVAHFVAHQDAIVNVAFDPSGMLLLTADKRGHDFNLFRIYPHPGGPSLAAVHHLYVLHRGDTTAKVQDISFSMDSRWVAVSSLRGTTHVFPITPYGGNVCIRTHGSAQVVNQLSRFHRSAGLSMDGRCSSPVTHSGEGGSFGSHAGALVGALAGAGGGGGGSGGSGGACGSSGGTGGCGSGSNGHYQNLSNAYANPRVPPFAHPTMVLPLTQLRQPYAINSGTQAAPSPHVKDYLFNVTLGRQRHSSLSDDTMMGGAGGSQAHPLRICATFARPRAWLLDPPGMVRDGPAMRMNKTVMDSLFIMASHGAMIQYDLEPRHSTSVVREKVCDDTPIELFAEAKAQWNLLRNEARFNEIQPPLPLDNLLLLDRMRTSKLMYGGDEKVAGGDGGSSGGVDGTNDDRWLSRVEIITHAGPHRRLWMGPQFIFKTYNTPSGSNLHHIEMESVEIGLTTGGAASLNGARPARSNPMNMPSGERPIVPVFIESGSYSSYEQSPRFRSFEDMDDFQLEPRDTQLREDLADAMRDCSTGGGPGGFGVNNSGSSSSLSSSSAMSSCMNLMVNQVPGTVVGHQHNHHHQQMGVDHSFSSSSSAYLPTVVRPGSALSSASIENIVNPLGTVTTVVRDQMVDSFQSSDIAFPDQYIHENCDEALFRPVVQVIEVCSEADSDPPQSAPVRMNTNLIVPVTVPTMEKKTMKAPPKITKELKTEEEALFEPVPEILPVEIPPAVEVPVVETIKQPPTMKQSKQKNKRNKEKTPPLPSAPAVSNVMVKSQEENNKTMTKSGNGSKGRKSSGQEPKAGKIRKSEKNNEIIDATTISEEEVKEIVIEVLPEPVLLPEEVRIDVTEEQCAPDAEFDRLPEVETTTPTKQEIEIIQDSLMKDTIVEAVTVVSMSGGGKKKKEKSRQKTPPKVEPEEEQEEDLKKDLKKDEMIVDISETKYDLAAEANDVEFTGMLVPLEPFEPKQVVDLESFENLEAAAYIDETLMTFESPVEVEREKCSEQTDAEKLHNMFADRNLVFALCTSLREEGQDENSMEQSCTAGEVSSSIAPGWQLEIHEDYMDLDRKEKKLMMMESMTKLDANKLTASTGSSEEEVSSSSTGDGQISNSSGGNTTTTATEDDEESSAMRKVTAIDDDEELQPLLKDKTSKEEDEDEFARKNGEEDLEVGDKLPSPSKSSSKETTPAPQGGAKNGAGGGGGQSSKKKSRKKKR